MCAQFPEFLAWFQTPQTVSRPSRPNFQPHRTVDVSNYIQLDAIINPWLVQNRFLPCSRLPRAALEVYEICIFCSGQPERFYKHPIVSEITAFRPVFVSRRISRPSFITQTRTVHSFHGPWGNTHRHSGVGAIIKIISPI